WLVLRRVRASGGKRRAPAILCTALGSASQNVNLNAGFDRSSVPQLFCQDTFFPGIARIEEQSCRLRLRFMYGDRNHRFHLDMVGGGVDGALVGLEHVEANGDLVGQERAAPAAWTERAYRGQRQQGSIER